MAGGYHIPGPARCRAARPTSSSARASRPDQLGLGTTGGNLQVNIQQHGGGPRSAPPQIDTTSGHHVIQARFWYEDQNVNNAKEDAGAEVALQQLRMGFRGDKQVVHAKGEMHE
ncbi:MAG: hypothetical protein LQ344_007354 [Seirophora lacunosa]|nr:MAG: hypothetical protein LQ344_007354 [Seirophora lacunosa]